jgi:hypothetical protein
MSPRLRGSAPWRAGLATAALLAGTPSPPSAATLKPQTLAAFERYIHLTEARIEREVARPATFLWIDTLPEPDRGRRYAALRRGELVIERLETREAGRPVEVPDALVHHWIGVVFVPEVGIDRAVALLQDYDRHAELYRPYVQRSRLIAREGDRFRVYLRFYTKKVVTAVVDTEHEARFVRLDADRVYSQIRSTRVVEIERPGTPEERAVPEGRGRGYLWRLNSYWRFLARDGGTYVQCESVSLTRDIPFGLGWLIGPFVTGIPKESLTFTLETTRTLLGAGRAGQS